jgi:FKBP-type peptidyl-prolyl cis-trans isomerase
MHSPNSHVQNIFAEKKHHHIMKVLLLLSFSFIANLLAVAQTPKPANVAQKPKPPLTEIQKTSYGFGVLVASNLKAQAGDSLDLEAFYSGIKDFYKGQPLQMKPQECEGLVQNHVQSYSRRKGERVRKDGVAYLEKNKKDASVKITPSGLQYKIISTGTGAAPTANDRVTVHYTGKLIDGTIFDSSVQRGQPATFSVNGVIKGWTEALQLMHEGDKWLLTIPQELAYGPGGNQNIPPYATLIFEVELIKVN